MLRSILVALDGSPWSETATTLALDWAARFDARLIGLGVLDEPSIDRRKAVPMGAYAYKMHRDERLLGDAHRHVLGFLEDFRSLSAVARLTVTVLEDIGDPAERILREGQRCDVVVLGRETHFRFETQDRPDATLAQVIRLCPIVSEAAPAEILPTAITRCGTSSPPPSHARCWRSARFPRSSAPERRNRDRRHSEPCPRRRGALTGTGIPGGWDGQRDATSTSRSSSTQAGEVGNGSDREGADGRCDSITRTVIVDAAHVHQS
jgi:nucleotide-binding universal stress UspA family protein